MPSLGVSVRDNMLGLFSFCSLNWGSFDIPLKKYTCSELVDNIKQQKAE